MTDMPEPRLYTDLARWWPLFSPPQEYVEEAQDILPRLARAAAGPRETLLELGSGGGSLASHLKRAFRLTLSDLSEGMLAVSRGVNPECEHVQGDMRSIELYREFDRVLIHDAIMYLTDADSVRAALRTAFRHCRPGGAVLVLPDCVSETFAPNTDCGGHDGDDGRALRWLEWYWDPEPADHTYLAAYGLLFREADGTLSSERDVHQCGLFPRAAWLEWFAEVGFSVSRELDPFGRDAFTATKPGPG